MDMRKRKRGDEDSSSYTSRSGLFVSPSASSPQQATPSVFSLNNKSVDTDDGEDIDATDQVPDDSEEESVPSEDGACVTEEPPRFPAYDADLPPILHLAERRITFLVGLLPSMQGADPAIPRFLVQAKNLIVAPDGPRKKIALLGDTAAGKSSIVNSMVDVPELAKEGAIGDSCTCVITEFQNAFQGQKARFAVRILYFGSDKILEILREQLEHYNTFEFEYDDAWDDRLREQYGQRNKTALDTFLALFCNHEGFDSPGAAKAFLARQHEDGNRTTIDIFVQWCGELLKHRIGNSRDHVEYFEDEEVSELRDKLDPLATAMDDYQEPSLWPLASKISIGVQDCPVLDHITFADLPGISDTHEVRVNACHDYLRSCDALWVVAKIERVKSCNSVDSLLQKYAERFKGNISIICTKSDEMRMPQVAKDLKARRQALGDYEYHTKISEKAKKQIERLRRQSKGESSEALDDLKRLEILVDVRNDYVIRGLQADMQRHLHQRTALHVQCVSNLHYAYHKGAVDIDGPVLKVPDTGIPLLRAHALGLPATDVFRAKEAYLKGKYAVFLQGLSLWTEQSSVQDRAELLSIVSAPEQGIPQLLSEFQTAVCQHAERLIVTPLSEAQDELARDAMGVVQSWKTWHWSSLKAFARNGGKWATSVIPGQCWNEQFLERANEILDPNWTELESEERKLIAQNMKSVIDMIRAIPQHLDGKPDSVRLPMDQFKKVLDGQIENVRHAYSKHTRRFEKEQSNIKLDATQDRHSGFFTIAMRQAYKESVKTSGKGVKQRHITIFDTHLALQGKRSPFLMMAEAIAKAVKSNVECCSIELQQELQRTLHEITDQFDSMINNSEVKTENAAGLRRHLREFLEGTLPEIETMSNDLDRIKSTYPKDIL
ncbi:hypothetical protein LTR66_013094 [Elasticomyces elasticus]|nr:hypothetical protein LTR66_013094 [Elasticomyces elasticus]